MPIFYKYFDAKVMAPSSLFRIKITDFPIDNNSTRMVARFVNCNTEIPISKNQEILFLAYTGTLENNIPQECGQLVYKDQRLTWIIRRFEFAESSFNLIIETPVDMRMSWEIEFSTKEYHSQ